MKDAAREDSTLLFQADFQSEESLKRRQGESEQERELRCGPSLLRIRKSSILSCMN
ncbi:Hypothetical protein DPCES_4143 [Desulfitobacterium hafniense]|uniref:Uncharacterized protein n=1 Tax=Desulfitobacterium hafniense TaxID=49338 RepID=A0A098B5B3_DESHA|nr:Hypothetical protein DPCES_4143 [Desulfitobacterium hafniense]